MLPNDPNPLIETLANPSALVDRLRFGIKNPTSSRVLMFCLSISAPPIACTDSGISRRLSSLFLAVTITSSITSEAAASDPEE